MFLNFFPCNVFPDERAFIVSYFILQLSWLINNSNYLFVSFESPFFVEVCFSNKSNKSCELCLSSFFACAFKSSLLCLFSFARCFLVLIRWFSECPRLSPLLIYSTATSWTRAILYATPLIDRFKARLPLPHCRHETTFGNERERGDRFGKRYRQT